MLTHQVLIHQVPRCVSELRLVCEPRLAIISWEVVAKAVERLVDIELCGLADLLLECHAS